MLHASSKGGLLKALGEGRFRQNMFFTSQVSSDIIQTNSDRSTSMLMLVIAMH
jgi:hypothetical protein